MYGRVARLKLIVVVRYILTDTNTDMMMVLLKLDKKITCWNNQRIFKEMADTRGCNMQILEIGEPYRMNLPKTHWKTAEIWDKTEESSATKKKNNTKNESNKNRRKMYTRVSKM